MSEQITILIPVYNDGESLQVLLNNLTKTIKENQERTFSILVVDDGSAEPIQLEKSDSFPISLLHLQRNVGHQKAIAIGLAYINENISTDKVLVMDSDGEDKPEDVLTLIQASEKNPDKIVFAFRRGRREGSRFQFFYKTYKLLFRLLTGKRIAFGNFLIMPIALVKKAVYYSEIWNHIAGGLLKSGIDYTAVPTDKGPRYAGNSKMNFQSLLMHGLGAISVFIETIATRLLIFSLTLICISLLAILILAGIRLFTNYAIPGWTSTVMSAMLIILLQSFLLSLFTVFLYLSSQSQRKFIPAYHYKDYLGNVETIE